MKRKFMLCQYPSEGFGSKSGSFYLLDAFGYKYGILDEYDTLTKEMKKSVSIKGMTFHGKTIEEVVEAVELCLDTKIERW